MHSLTSHQPAHSSQMSNEMKTGSWLSRTEDLYLGIYQQVVPEKKMKPVKALIILPHFLSYCHTTTTIIIKNNQTSREKCQNLNKTVKLILFLRSGSP